MQSLQLIENVESAPVKRGRGRPKGSCKKKAESIPMVIAETPLAEPLTRIDVQQMNVIEQVQMAFKRGNRIAAMIGLILGGFVPLASYTLVHTEVAQHRELWILVCGGLAYSALSVYRWALQAFHYVAKALGFVVLLEGTMTFSAVHWLSLAGLAILMAVNGVSAAVSLQASEKNSADDYGH